MKDLIYAFLYIVILIAAVLENQTAFWYVCVLLSLYSFINQIKTKNSIKYIRTSEIPDLLKRQKEDFTDTLNHDLKVPTLAQLRGIELLYNEILGSVNDEQKALLIQISDSCRYVLDMISMVQSSYKMDSNCYKLVLQNFSLNELVVRCFEGLNSLSSQKNLEMIYTPSDADTMVEADKTEIYKVVFNLLHSAINCSKSGGRISVKTYSDKNRVIFTVSGMELEINNTYSPIGHGIGMYMSKKIIELHNGKIFVPDEGNLSNTYTFVLPKESDRILKV